MARAHRSSRTEALRRQTAARFVGRRAQLLLFAENLAKNPDPDAGPDPAEFLFHVHGVGGAGKSTLIAQWREAAKRVRALTALVDETDVHTLESALRALARQLASQAGPLKEFDRAAEQVRLAQLSSSDRMAGSVPAAEGASLPARLTVQAALGVASMLPGAGPVTAMTNPDALAQGADRLVAGLRHRQREGEGEAERAALSRAFVAELWRLCEAGTHPRVVLFFDTWEQTGRYLDAWLREALDGAFGDLPLELVIVLAGREELSERDWGRWRPAVVDVPLDVFTEQEARDLLALRAVTDPDAVDAVLDLSMRLPLLVALLAQGQPGRADDVAESGSSMIDQAVDRFLQWIPEAKRRETVLAAALPLRLNRDILSSADPQASPDAWEWLLRQPFVTGHGDFKQYHAVVRSSVLRRRRTHAPRLWAAAHDRLAEAHAAARTDAARHLTPYRLYGDAQWRRHLLDETFHRLCASPAAALPAALEHTARIAGEAADGLGAWSVMLSQAAHDVDHPEVSRWAGCISMAATRAEPALEVLGLVCAADVPASARAWALTYHGNRLFTADRDDEALAELDQAVTAGPRLALARAYRGVLHSWHKRDAAGMADLNAALTLDSADPQILVRRGTAHRYAGRSNEAVADFAAALAIDPQNADAFIERGSVHIQAGRLDEAVADFAAAFAVDPSSTWALINLGVTHRMAGRLDDAVADLTAAIALAPGAWALTERGVAHHQAGRLNEAVADFSAALALDPNSKWALAERGAVHLQPHRLDEAVADLTAALAVDPNYARALTNRGVAHRMAGRLDQALADLTAAISLSPDSWPLTERGVVHWKADRLDEAVADLTAALAVDPNNKWAFTNRGVAHRMAGRFDEAVADLTAAITLTPEAWALTERGTAHRMAGRFDQAVADCTAAMTADPHYLWAINARGLAHQEAGRLDQAVADFTALLALDAQNIEATANRAIAHRIAGRLDEAVADYTAVLRLDPTRMWMRTHLTATYREAGQLAASRRVLDEAAHLDATHPGVALELAMLQLAEEGYPASETAWTRFSQTPVEGSGAAERSAAALRDLLSGLVLQETELGELVQRFLAVPGALDGSGLLRMYLRKLAEAPAPIGTRAAIAVGLIHRPSGRTGPAHPGLESATAIP